MCVKAGVADFAVEAFCTQHVVVITHEHGLGTFEDYTVAITLLETVI